jgi:uncharacterized membrane protein
MVEAAAFLLLLQIAVINVSGAVVFRIYGLSPKGGRFERGSKRWPPVLGAASLVAIAALLWWQFTNPPNLQRSSTAQRATQDARQVVDTSGIAKAVEIDARFTRGAIEGQNTLLVTGYLQSHEGDTDAVRRQLEEAVNRRLGGKYNVTPVVSLTVVPKGDTSERR